MKFIVFFLNSFNEFFTGISNNFKLKNEIFYQTQYENIYIYNSQFYSMNSKSLNIDSTNIINLLIESSFFINCSSLLTKGGAISFQNTNGAFILSKVCSISCFCDLSGQFSYSYTNNNKNNSLNYVSISYSSPNWNTYGISIYLNYGYQNINYFNSTYNQCKYHSSVYYEHTTLQKTNFSTFLNNYSNLWTCILISVGPNYFNRCNILNNTQSSTTAGIIYNEGQSSSYFTNCIIYYNTKIRLFINIDGTIQISNTWCDEYSYSFFINTMNSNTNTFNDFKFKICLNQFYSSNILINRF